MATVTFNWVLTVVQLQATPQMYQLGKDLQLTPWNNHNFNSDQQPL